MNWRFVSLCWRLKMPLISKEATTARLSTIPRASQIFIKFGSLLLWRQWFRSRIWGLQYPCQVFKCTGQRIFRTLASSMILDPITTLSCSKIQEPKNYKSFRKENHISLVTWCYAMLRRIANKRNQCRSTSYASPNTNNSNVQLRPLTNS